MHALARVFTARTVKQLAGPLSYPRGFALVLGEWASPALPLSYPRGFACYHDGRVETRVDDGPRLEARVRGTMPYVVKLWAEDDTPGWSCTCPAAEDGSFCKHCVAASLSLDPNPLLLPGVHAAVSNQPDAPDPDGPDPDPPDPDAEVAEFVERLTKGRLVEIVLEQAESDWRLRESLLARSRAGRGVAPDSADWRKRIDGVFGAGGGYVTYEEGKVWTSEIYQVIDALEELCQLGYPDDVALLLEHACRRASQAMAYVDYEGGWLPSIASRLLDLHHQASVQGCPDPDELAGRLVAMEVDLDPDLQSFYRLAIDYAELLGEVGLAAYREDLESRWRSIEEDRHHHSSEAYAVHEAMVGWALATGDPDALIEVHSRQRAGVGPVLEIARALRAAGREGEAIEWARRGLRDHPSRFGHSDQLLDYLAAMLRDRGDSSGAVELYWDAFATDPSLPTYRRLLEQADETSGFGGGWSVCSVEYLRTRLAAKEVGTETARRGVASRLARPLLDILLYEGRLEEAWTTANDFGCDQQMWLTLARAREQSHPLDAIAVYEPEVLALINLTKTTAYRRAVDLMDRIRRLGDAVDEPHRFTDLLDRVRTEHWRKRNLKKLLDARGWG